MELSQLKYASGSRKRRKIVGRGAGSGHGKTSTRGHKGQHSRSGAHAKFGFEGGQMPLHRRLPKRGFHNVFRTEYQPVNLQALADLKDVKQVTPEVLLARRVVRKKNVPIKILGMGEITQALEVHAHRFSKSAREKIEKAGGKAVEVQTVHNQASA
jgi:large subunit ribosomal protein L15